MRAAAAGPRSTCLAQRLQLHRHLGELPAAGGIVNEGLFPGWRCG